MNKDQVNKLGSYRAVKALLQSTTETSAIAALPARLAAFVTQIEEIDALDRTQNQPLDGRIADRDQLLADMIESTLELAGYALSHARENRLHDLAARVDLAASDFARLRLTRRTGLAQQVHDAIGPVVAQLAGHGVTAATLAGLQTKIDAADTALSQPRVTVAEKRAATAQLAAAFADADQLLNTHIDALLFPLRKTSPEFYAAYQAARTIVDVPGSTRPAAAPTPAAATAATAPPTPATHEKLAA